MVTRPHDVATNLYSLISGPAEQDRPWDQVRELFLPEAVLRSELILLDGTRQSGTWAVDEYWAAAAAEYRSAGFWEREISALADQFGNIAHVWSTYESRITSVDSKPIIRGINSFQLLRRDGRWRITSLVFQIERGSTQIPDSYLPWGGEMGGTA